MNIGVKIYGKSNCVFCDKVVSLCETYDIPYEYLSVSDGSNLSDLKQLLPDVKTVPQVWCNGDYIGGYEDFATHLENSFGNYGQGPF